MVEKHKLNSNGLLEDGVDTSVISDWDREMYARSKETLSMVVTPTFLRKGNPHDRVFFALFDGTGNDIERDPEHTTNVGLFKSELDKVAETNKNIAVGYVKGPGTQTNPLTRALDGAIAYTFDDGVEDMYKNFILQSKKWIEEDSDARISIITSGFSRGAERSALFVNVVHDRGIQNIKGMGANPSKTGSPTFNGPALVAPGRTLQAVALFDPVGTGRPQDFDRHLPSSVVTGLQIVARDEKRNLFPSSRIIWPGLSADRRYLSLENTGSHSDIGGGYHVDGLATRNRNLMATFINAMSYEPLLKIQPENWDRSRDAIHDSSQHMLIYRTSHYRKHGERDVVGAQESPPDCRKVTYCQPSDPLDPTLLPLIGEWHRVGDQPSLSTPEPQRPITVDMVQEEIITSQKPLAEVMAILAEKDPSSSNHIDVRAFDALRNSPVQPPPMDIGVKAPAAINEPQANVTPGIIGTDERAAARLREEREAMAFIESLRREQLLEAASSKPQAQAEAHPRNDPRNERHPDHRMYQSIYLQLGELNAQSNINASKGEMERITSALMVEAKRNHMGSVTHMQYGKDKNGGFMPIIHLKEAFHGDLDDPRTRWAALDGTKAVNQPIEQSLQQLEDVNQNIQQRQLMREAELSQQQGMGMSMSR